MNIYSSWCSKGNTTISSSFKGNFMYFDLIADNGTIINSYCNSLICFIPIFKESHGMWKKDLTFKYFLPRT